MFRKALATLAIVGMVASPALAQQGCPNGCHGRFVDETPVEQIHFAGGHGGPVHFGGGHPGFRGGFRRGPGVWPWVGLGVLGAGAVYGSVCWKQVLTQTGTQWVYVC